MKKLRIVLFILYNYSEYFLDPFNNENACLRKNYSTKISVVQTAFGNTGTTATWFFKVPIFHVCTNSNLPGCLSQVSYDSIIFTQENNACDFSKNKISKLFCIIYNNSYSWA